MMKKHLILIVRVGIACLVIATLLYVFLPELLNSFIKPLSLRQILIDEIKNYPGFGQDWLATASLITVSIYIYGFLAITILTVNLQYPPMMASASGAGRNQWSLLPYIIVGRFASEQQVLIDSKRTTDYRSIFSVIRDYSKSNEGIGSVALDIVSVIAVSYIGYTALQFPPSDGSLLVRIIDALMVGLWCYCIFSILMWFVFILAAWLQFIGRRI